MTTQQSSESVHWKHTLNRLLRAVSRDEVGSFKDVEDWHHQELQRTRVEWLRSEIEGYERDLIEIKKEIIRSGGGGIDTEHWYYKGIFFSIPGIKQILSYGVKNESWWTLYLLKHNIFVPLKLKQEGKIEALTSIITRYKEELKELTGE